MRLQGSRGLSLDRDGAGLLPPNRAVVWGSGWGLPLPVHISEHPTPPLLSEACPGAWCPP